MLGETLIRPQGNADGRTLIGRQLLASLCGLLVALLLAGCSLLPRTVAVPGSERQRVEAAFSEFVRGQEQCHCCIDAAAVVTLKGLLRSGTLSGYLQAMSPSFLRFVGVNPLGQPLLILVTDGHRFQYLAVPQAKEYSGSVQAETFAKYAPKGFYPPEAFFWLTGRLAPGPWQVDEVGRAIADQEGLGYWLTVRNANGRQRLLFDPETGVIRRHQVLDADGDVEMDVEYGELQARGADDCTLPGRITVTTREHQGTLIITLSDWLDGASLTEKDFAFTSPSGFAEVEVP